MNPELKIALCYDRDHLVRDEIEKLVRELAPHALIGIFARHEGVEKHEYRGVSIVITEEYPHPLVAESAGVPHVAMFAYHSRVRADIKAHLERHGIALLAKESDVVASIQKYLRPWIVARLETLIAFDSKGE